MPLPLGSKHVVAARDDLSWGWVLHGRPSLNTAMRLTSRAHEVLSRGGAVRGPLRAAALLLSLVGDAALVAALRRSGGSRVVLHAAANAADLGAWTTLSTAPGYSQLATAIGVSHPLAIEAGARYGPAGVGVPLLNAAVANSVRRWQGHRVLLSPFVWQVIAAAGGGGLARYARNRRRRVLTAHESALQAREVHAELTGLNEVTIGLGNVFDELQRATTLIRLAVDTAEPAAPVPDAATWKADVADRTRATHVYLADLLVRWQQHHNRRPDLGAVVALTLEPEVAPIVLTADDADRLWTEWSGLGLRGQHLVSVAERSRGRIVLAVGGHHVPVVPAVPEVDLTFDPLPGAFAWSAVWIASAWPRDGVRRWAAIGPAAIALGLMRWTDRRRPLSQRDRDATLLASSALTLATGLLQTRLVGSTHIPSPGVEGGIPRVPASLALRGHAFVVEMSRSKASPAALRAAWASALVTIVGAYRLTARPRPVREFAAELTWVAMAASLAHTFTSSIERDSTELERSVTVHDARRLEEAAQRGRSVGAGAATAMLDEAVALLEATRADLPAELAAEVEQRVERCRLLLANTRHEP